MAPQIAVTVTIQYLDSRTQDIRNIKEHIGRDLLAVKLPTPKKDNIIVSLPDSVKLVWPSVDRGGVLHRHLKQKTSPEFISSMRRQYNLLEIAQITLEETKASSTQPPTHRYHPYDQNNRPATCSSTNGGSTPSTSISGSTTVSQSDALVQVKQEELHHPLPAKPLGSPAIPGLPGVHPLALNGQDTNVDEANQLTRELWSVRRELSAGLAREYAILLKLKRLNAPMPDDLSTVVIGEPSVLQGRLHLVERELAEERQKRIEAENILKDIAQERAQPFIVPALLDAFVAVSKLTTKVESPA